MRIEDIIGYRFPEKIEQAWELIADFGPKPKSVKGLFVATADGGEDASEVEHQQKQETPEGRGCGAQ